MQVKRVALSNIFLTALLVQTLPQDRGNNQMLHHQPVQHFDTFLIRAYFNPLHRRLNAILLLHR